MVDVLFKKMSARVSTWFPNTRKLMKARGRRPRAFIVFECWWWRVLIFSMMKPDARVFWNSFLIASQEYKKIQIFTNCSHAVGKFVVTKNFIIVVICLFRKGVMIKSRFNLEFFTLFYNGLIVIIFSLENVLLPLIRKGVGKGCLFMLVSLF